MPDWSLLQTPNFAQAALSGYQAGSALGKQKQLDAAMSAIDLERPETLLPVLRADPSTGAALIGASTKLAAEKRDIASRQAMATYIKLTAGGGAGSSAAPPSPLSQNSATALSAPAASADPAAPGSDQADIVVTGNRPAPPDPMVSARNAAIDADPTGFMDIQSKIAGMNEAGRKRIADSTGAMAAIGDDLLKLPYQQRRGYIQMHASDLVAHGVTPEMIQSFDPTDDNIHFQVGQALGLKGQVDKFDKDRAFALQQQQFGETQNQHRIENGLSAQRVGLEAQNVGISAAHLALSRNADARAATAAKTKTQGAIGGIATPSNAAEYRALPSGTKYYKDGAVRIKQ